ncbi:DUF5134 domain-containing protein [Microbacterium sp. SA39]|uniref:DUF5134 domain-containing protein n=1 Tax=Microbacterium sp. SA39 TaxID=1263625 RepID=UPI0005FA6F54|nr:DUF5134 domain-containing protein [Microbacterium sp. SA39]
MIAAPWNIVLTLLFVATAAICLGDLVARRRRVSDGTGLTDADLIDLNHGVMSIAMIVMVWWSVWDAVTWAQVAIFAILALALIPSYRGAKAAKAVDLTGHIALDAAMIWMLAAMPLLMAGMDMAEGDGGAHAGHQGGGGMMLDATPAWADVTNVVFLGICAVAAVWWILRLFTARHHRIHTLCHVAMAAGMGWMLVLMNL